MICFKENCEELYHVVFNHMELMRAEIGKVKAGEYEKGSHTVNENLAFNYFSYQTQSSAERQWEAHKNHIDVHILLSGREKIEIAAVKGMTETAYNEKEDSLSLVGEKEHVLSFEEEEWLFLFPSEGHKTGVQWDESDSVTKVVFKIKVGR